MVKKGFFILSMITLPFFLMAQSFDNLDFSSFQSQDKGDPVAMQNEERRKWQEDYYYRELKSRQGQRSVEMERKVRETAVKVQQGISITSDNHTVRSQKKVRSSSRANQKHLNREAEHQAWLESKRASQAEASRRAAERRYRIEQRKRAEQQQRYNKAYVNEMQRTEKKYTNLHNQVDYAATEGFADMLNAQHVGTEQMQSRHITSRGTNASSIENILHQTSGRNTVKIGLAGNEHVTLNSDWNQAMDRLAPVERVEMQSPTKNLDNAVSYKMIPIANGCGTESDIASRLGAGFATFFESGMGTNLYQLLKSKKACNIHDLEYYYGVPKEEADKKLQKSGAYLKGPVLRWIAMKTSTKAYNAARKEREDSEFLQRKFNVSVPHGYMLIPLY